MVRCLPKLTVCLCLSLFAAADGEEARVPPVKAHPDAAELGRRDAIEQELDQNQATVKQLYAYLDELAEDDHDSRRLLESQIEQFDDRNAILYDELEELDRLRYLRGRKRDLQLRIQRLHEEATQLRRAGRPLPAVAREAKARELQKSIDDGTWQLDAADEWSCDADARPHQELVKLRQEFELLQRESRLLQGEVQRLRAVVEQLSKAIEMKPLSP